MRKSQLQLYGPFLGLVLVQALFISVAPSTAPPPDRVAMLPTEGEEPPASAGTGAPGTGGATGIPSAPGAGPDGATQGGTPAGTSGAGPAVAVGPGAPSGGDGIPSDPASGETAPAGDTSHCTADGRQHGVTYHAPPCVPRWPVGSDNGGATYQGVTRDEVRVVFFRERKNEHVAALLRLEGLSRTVEDERVFLEAAEEFVNKHYEFYGRKVDFILHLAEECPETPPDIPACRREARMIVERYQPFMVLWPVPLYPDVFDEFAGPQPAGLQPVISIGGWHFDARYFNARRPYRYDVFMDGTHTAELLGEYYCKKLARRNASHSGRVIHPTIGARDQVPRRLGIITPEGDAFTGPVQRLIEIVSGCDARPPVLARYQSDIEQAQRQAASNIQRMIDNAVTTVTCVCDPIAPIFRTKAMTEQNYYPENLLAGSGLLDYDKLGRLYEPSQWEHAFGPGHLQVYPPFRDTDAAKVWRDVGRSGEPCQACNLPWAYYQLAANLIQTAGPNLNPLTVEQGAHRAGPRGGWAETGGRAEVVMTWLRPDKYTAIADARETYWSQSAISPLDGRPGAYLATDGGRRYRHGQWGDRLGVPVKSR